MASAPVAWGGAWEKPPPAADLDGGSAASLGGSPTGSPSSLPGAPLPSDTTPAAYETTPPLATPSAGGAAAGAASTLGAGVSPAETTAATPPPPPTPSNGTTFVPKPPATPDMVGGGSFMKFASARSAAEAAAKAGTPWWRRVERTDLPNPGGYEDISADASAILRPNLFDGVQLSMNLPLSPAFSIGHTFDMGGGGSPPRPPGYAFTANYLSNSVVVLSRVDLTGRVHGRAFVTHTPAVLSKVVAESTSEEGSAKATWDVEHRGSDAVSSLKVGNEGTLAASYLQSVTPSVSVGGQGFYQVKEQFSALTAAVKYADGGDLATATVASYGPVILTYMRRVNPRFALAAEMFVDARSRESLVTAGYRYDLRGATVVGQVDSNGRVATSVEEKIAPGFSFLLSGEVDHAAQEYRFGFGLQLGS
ncbi:hypothetical protein I4F81_001389 [Pyropia yezoensis]|uniref:Uncharacterized protein n=1 Tax=Pyropia yezoensis TaxID=2788 RepID=A0ACC3BM24_PYRYE|nr:hypothetical protein I4F81_001389 [Neopyropia yezoensis]